MHFILQQVDLVERGKYSQIPPSGGCCSFFSRKILVLLSNQALGIREPLCNGLLFKSPGRSILSKGRGLQQGQGTARQGWRKKRHPGTVELSTKLPIILRIEVLVVLLMWGHSQCNQAVVRE
jgi:hypothetical protein